MPTGTYGVTPAGFVAKPTAAILADFEASELATMDPAIDLSPTGPQGQLNGIVSNAMGEIWQLLGVAFNSNNRQGTEGALLDNIGDEVGIPRETASYTLVAATLTFTTPTIGTTFPAGSLVANVAGQTSFTFANQLPLTVIGNTMVGVTMQATTIGATASVNPGSLTVITNPVSGWSAITNPAAQSVIGSNEELDANYAARQSEEIAVTGSCNPPAIVAALLALAAAQTPPIAMSVGYQENTTAATVTAGGITLQPHTFAVILYDVGGWSSSMGAGAPLIAQTIWNNKPAGIAPAGTTSAFITDPYLGQQSVSWYEAIPQTIYVAATIVVRGGFSYAAVAVAAQAALIAAAVAPTPAGGTPPNGQLQPGGDVIGSQLEAVLMAVPGMYDVQALYFDVTPFPANTAPIVVPAAYVATITAANPPTITQGSGP